MVRPPGGRPGAARRPTLAQGPTIWRYDPSALWVTRGYKVDSPDGTFPDWILGACGYLRAILFELAAPEDIGHEAIEIAARLYSADDPPVLLAEGGRPPYPFNRGPMFTLCLPEPIPNLNTSIPYRLEIKADQAVTLTASQLYHPVTS